MSYGQIRYLMKRLSTAVDSKLKQGRPPKYCRMCHRELRKLIGRQLERDSLEKKYMKGRNITEQRCDKRKNYFSAKREQQNKKIQSSVADPGPLLLGVLDRWTPTVNVLQTLISQISFHIELCPIEARDSISL